MPNPSVRPSLTTTLDVRYAKQRVGEAFDVKKVLGQPGEEPKQGKTIDAASQNGANFQSPNGFLVRPMIQVSQLKDVKAGKSLLSMYVKGLDSRRYCP